MFFFKFATLKSYQFIFTILGTDDVTTNDIEEHLFCFTSNFGQVDSKSKTCKQRGIKNDDQKEGESNQGAQMGGAV